MKDQRVAIFSVAALVVLVFSVSAALAQQCPSGQVPTTIINLAGKAVEICVGETALPHIGQEGIVVIPGICQCFSQEMVEAALNNDPDLSCRTVSGSTHITDEACTWADCQGPLGLSGVFFRVSDGPLDEGTSGQCRYPAVGQVVINNFCHSSTVGPQPLNEAQADACVAILRTFVTE
jgi:hypothetical protein